MNKLNEKKTERAPVVAVMGHIDHGKSTLLSYIRQSKKPLNEAGGITQHISVYEVVHEQNGTKHKITFLDTPGHEAFGGIRKRGASVADIAVLVVSAEDGVKPQTVEALSWIKQGNTPCIVAINKIDKPEANIDRTKQSLAEHEIYIEGYGGDISAVEVSAKTGQGVNDLLDMIVLMAELESLSGDPHKMGEGVVIESNRDARKGISATCIIKDGSIEKGMFVAAGDAVTPVRIMEDYTGKPLETASFSSPIKLIGWDTLPEVGSKFHTFENREEAETFAKTEKEGAKNNTQSHLPENNIPLVLKADTGSSLEAAINQIHKMATDRNTFHIISSGIGPISESDVHLANGSKKALIVGFNVKIDSHAKHLAERDQIQTETFEIIYKMTEWLEETLKNRTPKLKVEELVGMAKILKVFSKVKDKQIIGGRALKGTIILGAQVKILRRDAHIGDGKIKELQVQKIKSGEVEEGKEFGALIDAKVEIAPGDQIESHIIVEK
jgi:translation initiation factor IF-2